MTSYTEILYFLIFLPIVILAYYLVPKKYKHVVLLIASYIFFYSISGKLVLWIIFSTLSIHHFGLWFKSEDNKLKEELLVENCNKKLIKEKFKKKRKRILLLAIFIHFGLLVFFKYLPFFSENINVILKLLKVDFRIQLPLIVAPIGISFYTLQALSYIVDVYNKKIQADDCLGRLALYLTFFPTVMEGPITRYNDVAADLYSGNKLKYKNLCFGYQRILFGLMKKIVIANRLNSAVTIIYDGYNSFDGGVHLLGAILYTVMLYSEFSGTADVIIGSGEIFGVKIPENFKQPFFSKTISEFWTRWHISLGSWLKDYIFYPVATSEPVKKITSISRKKFGNYFGVLVSTSIAFFLVWSFNGLWHGAGWRYIAFGMYHFVLIFLGNLFEPLSRKITDKLKINRKNYLFRFLQSFKVFVFVCIGELIFRANGLRAAIYMLKSIFTNFKLDYVFSKNFYNLSLDIHELIIVFITIVIMFVIGILKEKNINIREEISKKHLVVRWTIYYLLVFYIILFGAYGAGYIALDPIYANF